jgi:hypothetical protein
MFGDDGSRLGDILLRLISVTKVPYRLAGFIDGGANLGPRKLQKFAMQRMIFTLQA